MESIDVSVVIPTFNRRRELPVALDSVFSQAGIEVECIVVDDCSSDGTISFIEENYNSQHLIIIKKGQQSGPQASRNLGISAARGEFVAFLDSDDYFEPNTLAARVQLCRSKQLDALFSGYRVKFVGRRWDLVKNVRPDLAELPLDFSTALLNFKIVPTSAIMYRRKAHPDLKLDESLTSGHDDDLSLHLIRAGRHGIASMATMTLVQHASEHVATPRNLMIGDDQLLRKYSADIVKYHGQSYLIRRLASALGGLWSVGEYKRSMNLYIDGLKSSQVLIAMLLAIIYLPARILAANRRRVLMALLRKIL